ncbi:MAG: 4Fe-4S binding protein [Desulfovibrionales bacterium]|nr:4Fe-4S binding protein [Desulfovibrionales bacterium]
MIALLRVLMALCSLTTAAHFLRFGTLWDAVPCVLPMTALAWPRILPRPLLCMAALGGALLWVDHAANLVQWRLSLGQPWVRLAAILGSVCVAHLTALALLAGQAGRRLFGDLDGVAWSKTAIFVLVSATLVLAGATTKIPLLMGERFFPDSGSFWIVAFALYGAAIGGLLLGNRADRVRGRIWTLFSAVFFGQLALGLAGWSAFLMTGKLHLPVPALILAGPIYRGEGFFMLTLLAVSLALVGPAWCSHLCYIGAWDDRLARWDFGRPKTLPAWAPRLRMAILVATILTPLVLRAMHIPWIWALGLAAAFGLAGVGIMLLWSRRTGTMTHCTTWCPVGLVNNLLGRILPWRIRIDAGCTRCGACAAACRYNALTRADLDRNRPGLTCSLCGDCLPRCLHAHIGYAFAGLDPQRSRQLFVVLVTTLHAVFLAVARI